MSRRFPSAISDASPLGQPLHFEFSGKTAPNRFLKGAMTERLSSWHSTALTQRGIPSEEMINVYKRWGEGGLGHILTGNIMIDYLSLEAKGNPIIAGDAPFEGERFERFKKLAAEAKRHGSLITGQLNHAGRQVNSTINPHPIAASDLQLVLPVAGYEFSKPRAASLEDIEEIVHGFAHAAEYLYKAGYDGVQLHAAHGYLLTTFLSKTTNKRTDQYGGSLKNRARIILEIAQRIREKVPISTGFIIGIKLNSVEFQEDGFTPEEARKVCSMLEEAQFDFVELSGGTYQALGFEHKRESTRKREAFFLEFAEMITPALTRTKTYVTGGFRTVEGMVNALKTVDGVGLGRPVCQEFRFAKDILEGRISGAIDQDLDKDDFVVTTVVAGAQLKQVGYDREPTDLSKKENVDAFMKAMNAWNVKLHSGGSDYGFVDLEDSIQSYPYGHYNDKR